MHFTVLSRDLLCAPISLGFLSLPFFGAALERFEGESSPMLAGPSGASPSGMVGCEISGPSGASGQATKAATIEAPVAFSLGGWSPRS